jgi:hypothetical protein
LLFAACNLPHTGSGPSSGIDKQTLGQVDPLYAALDNAAAAQDAFVEAMYTPAAASSAAQVQPAAAPAQQQSLPQPCATSSIQDALISEPSQQQQCILPGAINSQEGEQPCPFLFFEPDFTAAELAIQQELLELHGGVLPQQQSGPAEEEEVVMVAVRELVSMQDEMDRMEAGNLQLSASKDTAVAQLTATENKLADQKALNLQLEGMNGDLQASLEKLQTQFTSTSTRLYDTMSQTQRLQEANNELQQTTTLQHSSITHLQQERQQQQQTISEQQQSIAQLQETRQQQEAQLAAERASRREAEADKQQLCDQLAAEQEGRMRAEAHNKKLQELLVSHAGPLAPLSPCVCCITIRFVVMLPHFPTMHVHWDSHSQHTLTTSTVCNMLTTFAWFAEASNPPGTAKMSCTDCVCMLLPTRLSCRPTARASPASHTASPTSALHRCSAPLAAGALVATARGTTAVATATASAVLWWWWSCCCWQWLAWWPWPQASPHGLA